MTDDEQTMIRCLGLAGRVSFCPDLSEDQLPVAYSAAAAVVVPALYEGFGLPVLEAVACGTPVASSNGGSLPEAGGDTPFYFDPYDGDQIVAALDGAVETPRDSERIRCGIRRAAERTWDDVFDEYLEIYRKVSLP